MIGSISVASDHYPAGPPKSHIFPTLFRSTLWYCGDQDLSFDNTFEWIRDGYEILQPDLILYLIMIIA